MRCIVAEPQRAVGSAHGVCKRPATGHKQQGHISGRNADLGQNCIQAIGSSLKTTTFLDYNSHAQRRKLLTVRRKPDTRSRSG